MKPCLNLPMRASCVAAGLVAIAVSAHAQLPGTYVGQTTAGYPVQLVVAQGSDGQLSVTSVEFSGLVTCDLGDPPPTVLAFEHMGEGPLGIDGTFALGGFGFAGTSYARMEGRVAGDGTAGGRALGAYPTLKHKAPFRAEFCTSDWIDWTATLVPPGAAPSAP
jgi:hypothetical protein